MSPVTHLFASWLLAAAATDNPRDRRMVTLSGILPDVDGLGVVADLARQAWKGGQDFQLYQQYHHYLLHGVLGAALLSALAVCFARRRWRVAGLGLLVVHLHLLCDLVGSRGPSPADLWPIRYLAPFSGAWTFVWKQQWALDAWPNRVLSLALFLCCLAAALRQGDSFVGVFNQRADRIFVTVLRGWREKCRAKALGGGG